MEAIEVKYMQVSSESSKQAVSIMMKERSIGGRKDS